MAKVLIVLDGVYSFEAPAPTQDFTYTVLVGALVAAGHQVTKAHRESDASADFAPFNFITSVNLLDFDVIWLIGNRGRNSTTSSGTSGTFALPEDELAELARFMEAGGGVFATGDHDSIGSDLCGHIPRVRAMRSWYGLNDTASPMPPAFPRNFPVFTGGPPGSRADTTQKNPAGDYDLNNDGVDEAFVWFENQSDSIPQTITPTTSPAHPILRRNGADITTYPDHMHEGNTQGEILGHDYTLSVPLDGQSFTEFPAIAGERELPAVIAHGQSIAQASRNADDNSSLDAANAGTQQVNTLSVYDGRAAGVGRIVTGSTFHHYVDINLTGDTDINTPERKARTGPDAEKGQGFGYLGAETTFANIKAVFANITEWLARPTPTLNLILERSTFSQDEATANPDFDGAILVTVDGLKPSQFPGGGITTLSPSPAQLAGWAPAVTLVDPTGLVIEPIGLDSDDPTLPERLQRFTFTYRVHFAGAAAFGFAEEFRNIRVDAALTSDAVVAPLTDSAWIQLVKSANPFMLDLAGGNTTTWLSSDVRVFPVVAGDAKFGVSLPADASRAEALTFLRDLVSSMSVAEFESLSVNQTASALSPFATTTVTHKKVYNFAVARVRLNGVAAVANDVRVFFRIFTSQTTAALTYHESMGVPIEGYKKTAGGNPIAVPGENGAGSEWLSFPFFSRGREASPAMQTDPDNVKDISPTGSEVSTFFGALIDNNLDDPYLQLSPISGGAAVSLPTLLMGEHQCLVAQVEYAGTPIPDGARPSTSDKLSQRNIAMSAIANPGADGSRTALHTFEIEATPHLVTKDLPPDELLLDWARGAPAETSVRIFIPTWNAHQVVELADRFYPRHEIRALDAHTISVPGGGTRYVPIPWSQQRQTGVITADFPLGVKKGQRFDLVVRQVTNRGRQVYVEPPKTKIISREEAARLIQGLKGRKDATHAAAAPRRGVFTLDRNRTLITDLSVLDAAGDYAVIVEAPDPQKLAAAMREAASWRETIGAFQLGVPVSVKADMLPYHVRLLSVLRWRAQWLRRNSRWYETFLHYVDLMADKVRALGGDPFAVPATPDGILPSPPGKDGDPTVGGGHGIGPEGGGDPLDPFFEPQTDDWLADTTGLDAPDKAGSRLWSGKVSGLLFDHFGDFEGFTLETYDGAHHRFFSREAPVLDLARTAWRERPVVSVITVSAQSRGVRRILIRGYPD